MASRASRARKKLWFWTRWSFILARHLLGTCSTATIVAGLCLVLPLWLKIVFRYLLRSGPADANDQMVFWVYWVFALHFLSQMIVLPGQRTAVAEVAPLWYAVTATVVRGLRAQAARLHAHAALVRRRATRRMARGAAGPAAAAASSPSPSSAVAALPDPGEHPILPILPVLLPFLAPPERLALWRLGRAFAEAVWRSSPTSQLSLSKRPRPWLPSLVAATRLASDSSRLLQAVSAARPRFLPPATFRAHLRSLALTSLQFTRDELLALATALPALRHLHLWRCTFITPDSTPEATAASPSFLPDQGPTPTTKASSSTSAPRLPSHQLLQLHSLSYTEAESPLATPLSLVHPDALLCLTTDDPAQLTHLLATRSNPRAPLLGAAPLLFASLRTLKIPAGDSTALVTDDQLALLLHHLPALWEVWLPRLQLAEDHGHRSCSWGLLRLQDSHELDALTLAALPLGCIGRVLVERQIWVDTRSSGELEVPGARALVWNQAWPRLQDAADRLEFEPSVSGWSHLWAWSMPGKDQQALCQVDLGLDDDEPGFALHLPRACPVQARQLAELAAARVRGGTLVYSGEYIGLPGLASTCDLIDPAYALRPLRALSRSVRSVCLRNCAHVPTDPCTLFAFLPDHVQRLVVKQQEGRGAGVLNPKFAKRVFWRR